jgi:hypothetical protein
LITDTKGTITFFERCTEYHWRDEVYGASRKSAVNRSHQGSFKNEYHLISLTIMEPNTSRLSDSSSKISAECAPMFNQ